jgi:membrane protease YdiL (CAAX protease family)
MDLFQPLIDNLFAAGAYLFLMITTLSLWINRRLWLWGLFTILSLSLAYLGSVIELKGMVIIAALFLSHAALTQNIGGFWRLFATMIAALISFGFIAHMIVGFHNILLIKDWHSSKDAVGINFYINYDKPFIALFVLALHLPLIQNRERWTSILWQSILWMMFSGAILFGLAHFFECIRFDPKLPSISLMWIILQIFFVVIPEEGFFRGFLQREITKDLDNRLSGIFAIFIVAMLATLMHIFFIQDLSYLAVIFVGNILYGTIYFLTKSIESAIIVHFFTNAIHFFFFSYPVLASN